MGNKSKHKVNQPPTGYGKHQSAASGIDNELKKRSEVVQAQRNNSKLNIGDSREETADRIPGYEKNPYRTKAGR